MESKKTSSKKKLTLYVRAVYSGDQIQVAQTLAPVLGIRRQKYYLAFTAAPLLGKTDENHFQQPGAFEARQFLRKRMIGQKINLYEEYTHNSRIYVSLFHKSENINLLMIKNGLSKLITRKEECFQCVKDEFIDASEKAEANKLGIYADNQEENRRKLVGTWTQDFSIKTLVSKAIELEKPVGGIIEYVFSSSSFNIYLKYFEAILKINLPYVQSIGAKIDPNISAQGKLLAESRLLNKTVGVLIVGQDPYNGNILAKLLHPAGDIAKDIIKEGYGKVYAFSNEDSKKEEEIVPMKFDSDYFSELKTIQANSKKRKVGIWKSQTKSKEAEKDQNYDSEEEDEKIHQTIANASVDAQKEGPPSINNKYTREGGCFLAHVIEVVSGDMVGVALKKFQTDNLMRVSIAGLRAPGFGRKVFEQSKGPKKSATSQATQDSPCAWESKQFLRKLLVGKEVVIYIQKIRKTLQGNSLTVGTIWVKKASAAYQNIGESILGKGMANIVLPKMDQQIVKNFSSLTKAEQKAKSGKLGVHSPKKSQLVTPKFKQMCGKQYKNSAKQYSRFLLRKQKLEAVVEQVIGINRFKVRLNKQDCRISFSCQGVRSIRANSKQLQAYDRNGYQFNRQVMLQRDCVVDIDSIDIHGVYYGSLRLKQRLFHETKPIFQNDISIILAYNGLVYVDKGNKVGSVQIQNALNIAQEDAQMSKRGLWAQNMSLFVQKQLINSSPASIGQSLNLESEIKEAEVCDLFDAVSFHIQFVEDMKQLDEITAMIKEEDWDEVDKPESFKMGTKCVALFSADKQWYRAELLQKVSQSSIRVRFLDYGNQDDVLVGDLRKMTKSLFNYKPIAQAARLAVIRPFGLKSGNKSLGQLSGKAFRTMVWERKVLVQVVSSWKGTSSVFIWRSAAEKKDYKKSVNAILLEKGLASFDKLSVKGDISKIFENAKQIAKENHYGAY